MAVSAYDTRMRAALADQRFLAPVQDALPFFVAPQLPYVMSTYLGGAILPSKGRRDSARLAAQSLTLDVWRQSP